jgi:hypothetical protein
MRLRFTTRDLLWLILVLSVTLSWWVDHRRHDSPLVARVIKNSKIENYRLQALKALSAAHNHNIWIFTDPALDRILVVAPPDRIDEVEQAVKLLQSTDR